MQDAITDVPGIAVGHAQNDEALTGCTVVLAGQGAVVGVDVRGRAPGTRETDLCRPGTWVERAHAVLLTGGSAFGLDAAGGVMRYLRERGLGFETGVIPVPIVPAAVIFDLGIGEPVWPDADDAYQACLEATDTSVRQGNVGAGTGATVGKLLGPAGAMKAGLGTASVRLGEVTVGALMVVNAVGDVVLPGTNRIVAGARDPESGEFADSARTLLRRGRPSQSPPNTTIGVVATDAELDPAEVQELARMAHDGLARTIRPAHTIFDGDTIFALATGRAGALAVPDLDLTAAVVDTVERAVVNAVRYAEPAGGVPSANMGREAR
jgi:L-aminopeptidase/D-esterase-like protein